MTTSTSTTATTIADDALDRAYDKYRAGLRDSTLLSLVILGQRVREEYPAARTIQFEWSDQGDFLSLRAILDAQGNDLDEDGKFDAEMLDWNFGENSMDAWAAYMTDNDTGEQPNSRRTMYFNLPIEKALAVEVSEEYRSE